MDKLTKKAYYWRLKHLNNLIWSAKNPDGLFNKSDIPRFENEIKLIKRSLKNEQ